MDAIKHIHDFTRRAALPALILALLAVGGCATGSGRYACGAPDGVTCMSARTVYELTNDADRVTPATKQAAKTQQQAPAAPRPPHAAAPGDGIVEQRGALVFAAIDNPRATRAFGGPVAQGPVRTPPKVMRVWVNAWEDEVGDLHAASAVYTEIQPRRWSVGEQALPGGPQLRLMEPLAGAKGSAPKAPASPIQAPPVSADRDG